MSIDQHSDKTFFTALVILGLILTGLLLWPFLNVLILSVALAVVLYPMYRWFNAHITWGTSWLSSLCTVIVFIIIVVGPLVAISFAVFHQSEQLYLSIAEKGTGGIIDTVNSSIDKYLPLGISSGIEDRIAELSSRFVSSLSAIFTSALSALVSFSLIILAVFYFLKDGQAWKGLLVRFSPLPDEKMRRIIDKLRMAIDGVVKGYLLIGLIQGLLMGIGLALFGVPGAALWGLFAAIASLVPTFGTSLIAIPAIAYLFLTGHTGAAIGLIVWAAVLVGTIDNLLSPVIVGKRIDIHPMLILFSVLGGLSLMGPVGILVGPLIITFLYTVITMYREEYLN